MAYLILEPMFTMDAKKTTVFKFQYYGGAITKNRLDIRDNKTNELVYSVENNPSMKTEHIYSPAGSKLVNGNTYNAQIFVYSQHLDAYDAPSEKIVFPCYDSPSVVFENITAGMTIFNSSYAVLMQFNQAQGLQPTSYQLILYDSGQQEIWRSPNYYYAEELVRTRMIYNLEHGKKYYVECQVVFPYNMICTTGRMEFEVSYEIPAQYAILRAENQPDECSIHVSTNVILIDGICNNPNVKFIDNAIVDLTNGDNVRFNLPILLDGDFELKMLCSGMIPGTVICHIANGWQNIDVKYMEMSELPYETPNDMRGYFLLRATNGISDYCTTSPQMISVKTVHSTFMTLVVRRVNNCYHIAVYD